MRQSDSMRRRQTRPPGIARRRSGFGRCLSPLPGIEHRVNPYDDHGCRGCVVSRNSERAHLRQAGSAARSRCRGRCLPVAPLPGGRRKVAERRSWLRTLGCRCAIAGGGHYLPAAKPVGSEIRFGVVTRWQSGSEVVLVGESAEGLLPADPVLGEGGCQRLPVQAVR